jgi:hypothetical protein
MTWQVQQYLSQDIGVSVSSVYFWRRRGVILERPLDAPDDQYLALLDSYADGRIAQGVLELLDQSLYLGYDGVRTLVGLVAMCETIIPADRLDEIRRICEKKYTAKGQTRRRTDSAAPEYGLNRTQRRALARRFIADADKPSRASGGGG